MTPRIRMPIALAGAVVVAALVTPASAVELVLEGRYWSADPSGELRTDGADLEAHLDLEEDLGLQGDSTLEGRLLFRPSRRTLVRLAWTELRFSGEATVSRSVNFGGRTFDLDTRVLSDLRIDYGRVGFAWQFLSWNGGRIRLGPLVEAKGFRGEAALGAPDLPIPAFESAEFETAFASAGLILDLEPTERVHLFAEGSVLVDTAEGDLLDAEIGIRFFMLEQLALVGGYRTLEVDAEDGNESLDLEIANLFIGVSLHL